MDSSTHVSLNSRKFWTSFLYNMIWVNISGLPRYFLVVTPLLLAAFPDTDGIAPVSLSILASWGIWTFIFVYASTATYWMYFDRNGASIQNLLVISFMFTLVTIGLVWLAIANMGLAPLHLLFYAFPLGLVEQIISAWLVRKVYTRA